jgi:hypothetical protein
MREPSHDPDATVAADEPAALARLAAPSLPAARARDAAPLPLDPVLIAGGAAVLGRSAWRRVFGWKRYPGSVEAVCTGVIEDCWNGKHFMGSAGHFRQFWTRDLAMCTPALIRLGHRERVIQSWSWALERFERAGRITTTIYFGRYARDIYAYAVDSLPMLLWALRAADAGHLIHRYRDLLAREVERYYQTVYDPELGLARARGYFSSPRDCMTGRSTVFANTMLALLGRLLADQPVLPQPARGANVARKLVDHHWTGSHFRDALDRELPSGDGNVWPFFLDVLDAADAATMLPSAFATLDARGMTRPVPLRYFERRLPESELPIPRAFTPNYQGDTSWTQLGAIYLGLLRRVDEARFRSERATLSALIDRDRNYLEVYRPDGRPYFGRAGTYFCDEGMIWAALFLDLL